MERPAAFICAVGGRAGQVCHSACGVVHDGVAQGLGVDGGVADATCANIERRLGNAWTGGRFLECGRGLTAARQWDIVVWEMGGG